MAECAYPDPKDPGSYVAIDCEMVGCGLRGCISAVGRCSIVDFEGNCLLDIYIKPELEVTDYRFKNSGLRPRDFIGASPFDTAIKIIDNVIKGKIVVGHTLENDLDALKKTIPLNLKRDISKHAWLSQEMEQRQMPSFLASMAAALLETDIMKGRHCTVDDAKAIMALFILGEQNLKGWFPNARPLARFTEKKSYAKLGALASSKGRVAISCISVSNPNESNPSLARVSMVDEEGDCLLDESVSDEHKMNLVKARIKRMVERRPIIVYEKARDWYPLMLGRAPSRLIAVKEESAIKPYLKPYRLETNTLALIAPKILGRLVECCNGSLNRAKITMAIYLRACLGQQPFNRDLGVFTCNDELERSPRKALSDREADKSFKYESVQRVIEQGRMERERNKLDIEGNTLPSTSQPSLVGVMSDLESNRLKMNRFMQQIDLQRRELASTSAKLNQVDQDVRTNKDKVQRQGEEIEKIAREIERLTALKIRKEKMESNYAELQKRQLQLESEKFDLEQCKRNLETMLTDLEGDTKKLEGNIATLEKEQNDILNREVEMQVEMEGLAEKRSEKRAVQRGKQELNTKKRRLENEKIDSVSFDSAVEDNAPLEERYKDNLLEYYKLQLERTQGELALLRKEFAKSHSTVASTSQEPCLPSPSQQHSHLVSQETQPSLASIDTYKLEIAKMQSELARMRGELYNLSSTLESPFHFHQSTPQGHSSMQEHVSPVPSVSLIETPEKIRNEKQENSNTDSPTKRLCFDKDHSNEKESINNETNESPNRPQPKALRKGKRLRALKRSKARRLAWLAKKRGSLTSPKKQDICPTDDGSASDDSSSDESEIDTSTATTTASKTRTIDPDSSRQPENDRRTTEPSLKDTNTINAQAAKTQVIESDSSSESEISEQSTGSSVNTNTESAPVGHTQVIESSSSSESPESNLNSNKNTEIAGKTHVIYSSSDSKSSDQSPNIQNTTVRVGSTSSESSGSEDERDDTSPTGNSPEINSGKSFEDNTLSLTIDSSANESIDGDSEGKEKSGPTTGSSSKKALAQRSTKSPVEGEIFVDADENDSSSESSVSDDKAKSTNSQRAENKKLMSKRKTSSQPTSKTNTDPEAEQEDDDVYSATRTQSETVGNEMKGKDVDSADDSGSGEKKRPDQSELPTSKPDWVAIASAQMKVVKDGRLMQVIGRVGLVDFNGQILVEACVEPDGNVMSYGSIPRAMFTQAKPCQLVREEIQGAIKDKTLVGFNVKGQLKDLGIEHPSTELFELQQHPWVQKQMKNFDLDSIMLKNLGWPLKKSAGHTSPCAIAYLELAKMAAAASGELKQEPKAAVLGRMAKLRLRNLSRSGAPLMWQKMTGPKFW